MSKKIKYLIEEPVDKDLFNSIGGHEQVAQAIMAILQHSPEHEIIGIEGVLGGGKSSIVRMLERIITQTNSEPETYVDNKTKKFRLFTFDVDVHHTAIKSSLVTSISGEIKRALEDSEMPHDGLVKKLQNITNLALGKKYEYEKNTVSNLTPAVILFSISLVVMASSIRPFLVEFDKLFTCSPNHLLFFIYLSLVFSPLLLYLITKIFFDDKESPYSMANMLKRNGKDTISEMITINKEVGSMELETTFKEYNQIIEKIDIIFILVLDNIDRLSPKDIKTIWSELEIFASLCSPNFRILVPFSEMHTVSALAENTTDEARKTAKEYITKKLPIVFSAPPIITYGWKTQFINYYSDTFGNIDCIDEIINLIEIWNLGNITPRFLKNLINLIATKIEVCPHLEKLNNLTVAAYVLTKSSLLVSNEKTSVLDLIKTEHSNIKLQTSGDKESTKSEENSFHKNIEKTKDILEVYSQGDTRWAIHIMALHYQTSEEIAKSELLKEPIKFAITNLDTELLFDKKNIYAFDKIFLEVIKATDPLQATKFAAELIRQNPLEKEWIQTWVDYINAKALQVKYALSYLDVIYIESIKLLKYNQIAIAENIVKNFEKMLQDNIENIFNKSLLVKINKDTIATLIQNVKDCYACSLVTQTTPYFITHLNKDFYILILWSLRTVCKEWKIEEKLKTFDNSEIALKASELLVDKPDYYFDLLDTIRYQANNLIGNKLECNFEFVQQTTLRGKLSEYPFTKNWGDNSILATLFSEYVRLGTDEKQQEREQFFAMLIVAIIKVSNIDTRTTFINESGGQIALSAREFLTTYSKSNPNYKSFLFEYILLVDSFETIITFASQSNNLIDLTPVVTRVIKEQLCTCTQFDALFSSFYVILKSLTSDLKIIDLLNWLAQWNIPSCSLWNIELLKDLTNNKQEELVEVIRNFLATEDDNLLSWEQELGAISEHTTLCIQILVNYKRKLTCSDSLYASLSRIVENELTERVIPNGLIDILSRGDEQKIIQHLDNKFKSSNKGDQTRRWIINNFSSYKLPKEYTSDNLSSIVTFISLMPVNDSVIQNWLERTSLKAWKIELLNIDDLKLFHETLNKRGVLIELGKSIQEEIIRKEHKQEKLK